MFNLHLARGINSLTNCINIKHTFSNMNLSVCKKLFTFQKFLDENTSKYSWETELKERIIWVGSFSKSLHNFPQCAFSRNMKSGVEISWWHQLGVQRNRFWRISDFTLGMVILYHSSVVQESGCLSLNLSCAPMLAILLWAYCQAWKMRMAGFCEH